MREYAQICLNGFCFIFPIVIPCLLERVLTYFSVYTKIEVLSLKENYAALSETQKFSITAVILFSFCFRVNIFTSKISNLVLPSLRGPTGDGRWVGVVNLDIPYFRLLLFVAFLLEHNLDEKSMRNIDVRIHVNLEVKVPIFWTHPPHPPHTHPKITHTQIFNPRNPSKKYFDPCNPRNSRKKLTHATHGPTQPKHPRNPRYYATHAI